MLIAVGAAPPAAAAEADIEAQVVGSSPEAVYLRAVHNRVHRRWAESFLRMAADQLPTSHPVNYPARRVVLALTLASDGTLAIAAVADGAGSGSPDFDAAAVDAVKASTPFPAAPVEALSDDGQVHLRWSFARDGRRCGDLFAARQEGPLEVAVPRLFSEGRDAEALRRVRAAAAAGYSPENAIAALAAAWLARAGKQAPAALPPDWVDAGTPIAEKVRELDALAAAGRPARKKLVALSRRAAPPVRAAALIALGRAGEKRAAVLGLTSLLRDPSVEVRTAAAAGLAGLAGEGAVPRLAAAFLAELDPAPYEAAAARLARLPGAPSAELLGRFLRKGDRRIRLAGAAALAVRFDEPARRALATVANDTDPLVRFHAAAAVPPAEWRDLAAAVGPAQRAVYRTLLAGPGRAAAGVWLLTHFDELSPATQVDVLAEFVATSRPAASLAAAPGAPR